MFSEVEMPSSKPTPADAELILRLYDVRREAEMRKARDWWVVKFWPQNADQFMEIVTNLGSQENNWLRQVASYWGIAASFVLKGALNEDLFMELSFCGEMFLIFAKVHPFIGEVRERLKTQEFMANVEKLIKGSEKGRERLKQFEERVAARRKTMAEAAVAKAS